MCKDLESVEIHFDEYNALCDLWGLQTIAQHFASVANEIPSGNASHPDGVWLRDR